MALSTTCCNNLSPPTPNSASKKNISLAPSQISWEMKEGSRRNRCFVGMAACMIIGLETGLLSGECHAFTEDSQIITVAEGNKLVRWSDKRMCPPWQMNSLEIIVPENLPRPSAHRKLEAVTLSRSAPMLKFSTKTNTTCFSM
ncbi:hypothetical protein HHK36_014021 [Tetracentron sinense]|uniref:Uncharacterized protein n=1 Tax=Tetracentron sinense TaxID=13715 RepID=A0A834Z813_TETSI|nr:hypothetical protein HHK36_014021 [Tetracentron sinense]